MKIFRNCYMLLSFILFQEIKAASAQKRKEDSIKWCTVNDLEQKKCNDFSDAVRKSSFIVELVCKQASDKNQCMKMIDTGDADLITLDPGEIFVAGRYNSLVPIMAERYGLDKAPGYYAVAVISPTLDVSSLHDLRGKRACFPGVGQTAGWVIPIGTLVENGVMIVKDCNNLVKNAASFFGPSCAPNSLTHKYNPAGDNPLHMCELCAGEKGIKCSGSDPFANFDGAFNCLANGGDVAFLKHTTVDEETTKNGYHGPSKSQFRLLCPNGLTAHVDSYQKCNWGFVPSHAIVTSTSASSERRALYQDFMLKAASRFSSPDRSGSWDRSDSFQLGSSNIFQLFGENAKYDGKANLLFQDMATTLTPLERKQQTFSGYLGGVENYQQKLQKCPIPPARLCVVSDAEMKKCQKLSIAFRAQMLKPDVVCIKEYSQYKCMRRIAENSADITVLDAGDIYHAGLKFNLMPIISEQYDLEDPTYYVIAIARQSDKDTDLLYLKGKRSCHTGIGMAAGWTIPMSFLLSNDRMRSYGCDSALAAAEFFQKSCVPGALSREYGSQDWQYSTLCDLCHGVSSHFCARDSHEPFYGHTGALRCLVEGGGEIAFVKHTTIQENTAGKNKDMWARPMMPNDFELLCRDGTRAPYDKYEECNLGRVSSNALVTGRNKPPEYINAYIDLFMYAQQYYGSKYSEEFTFKMFVSEGDFSDLIFQDATQQLIIVPQEKRNFRDYLGYEFLQAMALVDCSMGNTVASNAIILIASTFILKCCQYVL